VVDNISLCAFLVQRRATRCNALQFIHYGKMIFGRHPKGVKYKVSSTHGTHRGGVDVASCVTALSAESILWSK
jgi:hypothetical protein